MPAKQAAAPKQTALSKFAKTVKPVAAKVNAAAKAPAKSTAAPKTALPSSEDEYVYPKGWKPPKTAAAAADLYYEIRQKRLQLEKGAAEVEEMEKAYKHWLITTLPSIDAGGISGKIARVTLTRKDVPRASDWSKTYRAIVDQYNKHLKKKTGQEDSAFAILNRALNAGTINEMWHAGEQIPGVDKFTQTSLSLNKL